MAHSFMTIILLDILSEYTLPKSITYIIASYLDEFIYKDKSNSEDKLNSEDKNEPKVKIVQIMQIGHYLI